MLEIKNFVPKMKKAFVDHQQTELVKKGITELEDMSVESTNHRFWKKEAQNTPVE